MSHLSQDYEQEIRWHLALAEGLIKRIESGAKKNGRVVNNDFLEPTILMGNFPFNDQQGEMVYYQNIRDALKIALKTGIVPKKYFPYLVRAPQRIRGLLERDDPDRIA